MKSIGKLFVVIGLQVIATTALARVPGVYCSGYVSDSTNPSYNKMVSASLSSTEDGKVYRGFNSFLAVQYGNEEIQRAPIGTFVTVVPVSNSNGFGATHVVRTSLPGPDHSYYGKPFFAVYTKNFRSGTANLLFDGKYSANMICVFVAAK